jgi:hypothetical protein
MLGHRVNHCVPSRGFEGYQLVMQSAEEQAAQEKKDRRQAYRRGYRDGAVYWEPQESSEDYRKGFAAGLRRHEAGY